MSLFLLKREKELPDIQENDDELYRSIHAGIWKNTKSHELIGVEMAEDIDDVFEDIQQDILDDLKGMKDYSYPVYRVEADYIDSAADTSKYDYQMLGVVKPERTAPKKHTCWHGIIETELTE